MSGASFRRWNITRAHYSCSMCARVEAIAREEFSLSDAAVTRSESGDHWVEVRRDV